MIYEETLWQEKIWLQDLNIPLDSIKAKCLKELEKDPQGVNKSNIGGWQSKAEKFDFLEPVLKASEDLVHYAVVEMGIRSDLYVENVDSWININNAKDFNMPHTHPDSLLSSVFYVESTDMNATINFMMPEEEVKHHYLKDYLVPSNYSNSIAQYAPVEGRMIIFPAYLKHWVNPSSERRISIASNYKITQL